MAAYVLNNAQIILGSPTVGAIDISQWTGSVDTSPGAIAAVPCPNFGGGGYMLYLPGLYTSKVKLAGYADYAAAAFSAAFPSPAATVGQQIAAGIALPQSGNAVAATDPMHFTRGVINQHTPLAGATGAMAAMTLELTSDTGFVTGQCAAPLAARTTTANGTSCTLAGPTAAQRVWAAVWITAVSGTTPSVTVKIQSAPASNFAAPTDRITFTAANATGWQFASLVGPVTDGFWRAVWTISGTTPSFTFMAAVAVD